LNRSWQNENSQKESNQRRKTVMWSNHPPTV